MRKYLRVAWAWLGDEMSRRRLLRLCLIAGMLAGLFAHGFMFANKIPNHDDLYYDVDISGAGVESGRFALFFFWKLFSNLSAPWLNGILGVGFLSCAAALLSDAFGLRRRWQALSLTLIVVVFPENISLFCFMYEAHVFALGVMFAALAAWLVPRGRFGWLWAVVVVVLATGIYQVYLLLATGLMVIAILREVSVGGHAWKLTVRCAAAALAGLVLYMLAAKLALRLTGSALNQYQGIDKMGSLDVSAIPHQAGAGVRDGIQLLYRRHAHLFDQADAPCAGGAGAGRRGCCRLDCGTRFRAQTGHGRGAGDGLHGGASRGDGRHLLHGR